MPSATTEATPLRGRASSCSLSVRARLLTIVASIAEGYDLGIMVNALGPLRREFGLSPLMLGILTSSLLWAYAFAAPLTGSLTESIGRKPSIAISCAFIAAGNICWALAPNFALMLTGRIFIGIGVGMGMVTITMYMAEVAPLKHRGLFVSLEELFVNVGILAGFVAGALLLGVPHDWRIMVGIGAVLPIITCICAMTPCLPESPRFLQANGRKEEAREILLMLLDGDEQEVNHAFERWAQEAQDNQTKDWRSAMSAFCGSHSKVAIAGIGTGFFFMASGVTALVNYSALFLTENGMSEKKAAVVMVIWGIARTCAMILPIFFLLDSWGRKPVMLTGQVVLVCACCYTAFANYHAFGGLHIAGGLILFGIGLSIGIGPASFAYISEVFDNSIRAKGVAIALCLSRLTGAFIVLIVPVLISNLGITEVFLILAGSNACAFFFYWFCCPETQGVSLEEMNGVFEVGQKQAKI